MTPFEAYVAYVAVKRHFSGDYDYFKYGGKLKLKRESFERRSDRHRFERLASHHDPLGLLVSYLSRNPDAWIGEIVEDAEDRYVEYTRNTGSFTYLAESQLKNTRGSTFVEAVYGDEMPRAVARGDVSLELAAMLDHVTHMTTERDWGSMGPSMEKLARRVKRYAPFVRRVVPVSSLQHAVKKVFDDDGNRREPHEPDA